PPGWVVGPGSVLGPEFGIYSTVTSLKRANLINNMLRNAVPRNTTNPFGPAPNGTRLDLSALVGLDPDGMADYLNRLLHGTMSDDMRAGIVDAVSAVAANNPFKRAWTAVYLVFTSSQYQVQR